MTDEGEIIEPTRLATPTELLGRWTKLASTLYVALGVFLGLFANSMLPTRTMEIQAGHRYAVIVDGPGSLKFYSSNKVTVSGVVGIQEVTSGS